MKTARSVPNLFALIAGAFLVVEGVWGTYSNVVFGVLTTNRTHALIHILFGVAGIAASMTGNSRVWSLVFGVVVLLVGVLRFLPGAGDLIVSFLNVNEAVAMFNIVVGLVSIAVSRMPATPRA